MRQHRQQLIRHRNSPEYAKFAALERFDHERTVGKVDPIMP
jgi:hypothetical protein